MEGEKCPAGWSTLFQNERVGLTTQSCTLAWDLIFIMLMR